MSTETQIRPYIPDESEVAAPHRSTWRIAEGKIVTGRKEDGSLKDREKIVGLLRRISIQDGNSKSNGAYFQVLEADIETAAGPVRFHASTTNMKGSIEPSTVALTLAEGLLDLAKDELILLTAGQSTRRNSYGTYTSFCNLFHLDAATKRTVETKMLPRQEGATMVERWEELAPRIKTHPAYLERKRSDEEGGSTASSHFGALCKELADRGWPTPEQAPNEWLNMVAKGLKKPNVPGSVTQVSDDEWGTIRQVVLRLTTLPGALGPVAERLKAAGGVDLGAFGAETPDPFAGE